MSKIRTPVLVGALMLLASTVQAQLISPDAQRSGTNGSSTQTGSTGPRSGTSTRVPEVPSIDIRSERPSVLDAERLGSTASERAREERAALRDSLDETKPFRPKEPVSTEFSRYASKLAGQTLPVFGGDFFGRFTPAGALSAPAVPPDYTVNVGDELLIQITGSLDTEMRQQVRRGGEISLPRVGSVRVAGVQASELSAFVKGRLETQFRNIEVSVSFAALRGMRVFVTGFVAAPGPLVVDSLSTLTSAIAAAGGPAEGGSYRAAELWRKGRKIASFDLYQFLALGNKSGDTSLNADDVIRVLPASPFQVALTGSVNRPGVYELLPGENLTHLLEFAGGLSPIADVKRIAAVELDSSGQRRLSEVGLPDPTAYKLTPGVVLHVFSGATLSQSITATQKIVHVEGEVAKPGSYVLPAMATLQDALTAAGGPTTVAHMHSLSLYRPELVKEQQVLMQRSLDELEKSMFEAVNNTAGYGGDVAQASSLVVANTRSYIERLRQFKPNGRLVVSRLDASNALPPVLLNGDRVVVPPKPDSVAIFGAVYGEGSYQTANSISLADVLKAAGGLRRGADADAIVVLRSDGSFTAASRRFFEDLPALEIHPGDTVFVPTDTQRGRFWVIVRDIGTMLYQFGLGAAAFKALN